MQILTLELENVKSYAHTQIDFRHGVNAIVGWNGAGKSTILEAIGFALFDHLGYNQRDFVREGQKSGTITVHFISSADLRRYEAVRRFGSSNQHYVFDPELDAKVVEGKADVLTFLRRHMGVEPGADLARLFSDAVGVPQGAFTAAFLGTPAQRKATFDPLLQVDEYKRAFDGLREPLNALKEHSQALSVETATLRARLENAPELDRAIAERKQELAITSASLKEIVARVEEVKQRHAELEAQEQALQQLQQRQQTVVERRAGSEQRVAEAERLLAEAQAAAIAVAEHKAGHDAYVAAQQTQRMLDKRLHERQQLRDQRSEADKQLALSRSELARIDAELKAAAEAEATVARLAPALAEQERLETARSTAQQQEAQRQTLAEQVERQAAELATRQARAEKLQAQLAEAARIDTARATLEEQLVQRREALNSLHIEQHQIKATAERLKEQTTALQSTETARCPVCEQPLSDEHRRTMLARNETQLGEMRATFRDTQELATAESEAIEAAERELKQLQQQLRALPRAGELTGLQDELSERAAALETARRQLSNLADISQEIQGLEQALAALGDPRRQSTVASAEAARQTALTRRYEELNSALAAQQAVTDRLGQEIAAFGALDEAMADAATALKQHERDYQAVLGNQQLAANAERYTTELATLQAARQRLSEEENELAAQLDIVKANFDAQHFAASREEMERLRDEQTALQTRQAMLVAEQERDEEKREQLRTVEVELARVAQEQAACMRREEVLDALRRVLREAGPYITATLIRQISEDAARIFADLMQDHTRHLTWTEDYNIVLDVNGNARQFSQLSGGEQMSAALAVRLALLREMSNIDIAFFDEPTTNLDEARRDSLAQQILNVKGLRQLFVISHDDTFEQATQNLIRVEKAGGGSFVMVNEG
jgi:exonuclease SbcC